VAGLVAGFKELTRDRAMEAIAAEAEAASKAVDELVRSLEQIGVRYRVINKAEEDLAALAKDRNKAHEELRRLLDNEAGIYFKRVALERELASLADDRFISEVARTRTEQRIRRDLAELAEELKVNEADRQRIQEAITKAVKDEAVARREARDAIPVYGPSMDDMGPAKKPRGAGGRAVNPMVAQLAQAHQDFLTDEKQRAADAAEELRDYAAELAWANAGIVQSYKDAEAAAKAAQDAETSRVRALVEEVSALSQTFADALTPMGHWGEALTKVLAASAAAGRGLIPMASAVAASSAAVVGGIADEMDSISARMALKAVEQLGLGVAMSLINPPLAATHFKAAGILGIGAGVSAISAATGGGGLSGSDRAVGQPSERGIRPEQGGNSPTIVVNSTGVLDGHGLVMTIEEARRRAYYSGADQRQGAW